MNNSSSNIAFPKFFPNTRIALDNLRIRINGRCDQILEKRVYPLIDKLGGYYNGR